MDIQIERMGKIVTGEERGCYVKIIDDSASTGGFLIITSSEYEMRIAHDNWVPDFESLIKYFTESDWKVEWL